MLELLLFELQAFVDRFQLFAVAHAFGDVLPDGDKMGDLPCRVFHGSDRLVGVKQLAVLLFIGEDMLEGLA